MHLMITILIISLIIVLSGSIYKKVQDMHLTEPIIAVAAGVICGPYVFGIIEKISTAQEHNILETACKFTIAMALMSAALRIPPDFYIRNKVSQGLLVVVGMLLMWMSSSVVIYLLLPISFFQSLLIGAIITPTDPVLASAIISGEKASNLLPKRIRNTISFEAGINDGLAFPIVTLAFVTLLPSEHTLSEWITKKFLYETILASIVAYGIGYGAGWLLQKAHKAGFMENKTLFPFSVGLALLLLSGLETMKMNGIIGVFIGGIAFARHITENEDLKEERVQESIERITTIPIFFIFGTFIPWNELAALGWLSILIPLCILLFRRLPAFLLMIPFLSQFKGRKYDALILGWYGPIGVAALFYVVFAMKKIHLPEAWHVVCLVVLASTLIHGFTSIPFAKWYDKHKQKEPA